MSGVFYGIGVGPGDPELITLKAVRIMAGAPVIAYSATEEGESMVRAIAAPHLPDGRIEIAVRTPIGRGPAAAEAVYDGYAAEIARHLDAGRDVAFLCQGDPFVYGSFAYLHERLAARHTTRVVPGVSSLGAVAAAAGVPLVRGCEVLSVVPAPLAEAELETRLGAGDAVAVVKVGRHLAKVRRVIQRLGLMGRAVYVERATMENQRVLALARVRRASAPYFSMIVVPGNGSRSE
ncbi:MAG TPA: precorrin-2 C(20)-methyltransferase [Rhodospirillales bacterium]|jgi:precorrin-2/cobalt-factor-2 C20-methyltransferase|nr:precorrin-2 C(20)-methyltransferase [Rhodospirillales bacterium]HJO68568.1 precorrin-2 C(20)-methyltransferase [Rhodospirillales bacterium]